jgi:hypothetical protein
MWHDGKKVDSDEKETVNRKQQIGRITGYLKV